MSKKPEEHDANHDSMHHSDHKNTEHKHQHNQMDNKDHSSHSTHKNTEQIDHNDHGEHGKQMEHGEHGDHGTNGKQMGHSSHHQHMIQDYRQRFYVSMLLTVPILIFSPTIQSLLSTLLSINFELTFPGVEYVLLIIASIIYIYGGYPFLKGLKEELQKKQPGMMTLVAVAITVSYVYSAAVVLVIAGKFFFWELATLIDIMLLGHWLEMRSIIGASRALESLVEIMPKIAHRLQDDGTTEEISVSQLQKGDQIRIKPGEQVPADGFIVKGETSINESMLTGESQPVPKKAKDNVIGGSLNGEGSIVVEIDKTGEESYLSQVVKLVQEAQESRSKSQDLANRAAFVLTIVAIVGGSLTFGIWMFFTTQGINFALERMVTVIVITCPHALGLAVPLVVAMSTSISAKNGLLIRNRVAFERGRNIQTIVFDKTGTLTQGQFGVTNIVSDSESQLSEQEIISYAASLEDHSEHPIGQGIVKKLHELNLTFLEVDEFKAIPGKGIQGTIQGKSVKMVSPNYLEEFNIDISTQGFEEFTKDGKTTVFLLIDGKIAGMIALADIIRPEAKEAIKQLDKMNIKSVMLTGDNKRVASYVAQQLGLDEFYAEVLPNEKASVIKKIQATGAIVAMVGDGVNDAPALVQADLGLAIGAGTDVAIESADVILVKDNPLDIPIIIQLARKTYRKIQQNLVWATAYNVLAIPLAAGVLFSLGIVLSPAIGAVLMSISTIIVSVNAKFLKL